MLLLVLIVLVPAILGSLIGLVVHNGYASNPHNKVASRLEDVGFGAVLAGTLPAIIAIIVGIMVPIDTVSSPVFAKS